MIIIIRNFLFKHSEPFRIENGFGLSPIRNQRELKALIRFCKRELKEDYMELNPDKKHVLETTVRLYNEQMINNDWSSYVKNMRNHIGYYIEDHISYYWS